MKNNYLGMRERILHAATVEEAQNLFGGLNGYPAAYISRCKSALKRCTSALSKSANQPQPKKVAVVEAPAVDWHPGDDADDEPVSKAKRSKKR